MRVDESFRYERGNIQSTLINSHATLVLVLPGHESWENSHANSRFSTLINSHQLSCNSCSRLTGAWELRKLSCKLLLINSHATLVLVWPGHENWGKLSCKLSLLNSHQLSCNSCSRLTGARESRKLSCKLPLLNSHQLSCNSCSRLTGTWELRKLSCKFLLLNSHQLSCNSCSRLTGAWDLIKLSYKLSLLNSHQDINSHATLVLVWPGHESWENSHTNSCFSTLINSHANSSCSNLIPICFQSRQPLLNKYVPKFGSLIRGNFWG
jgi:hypothetical protein